MASHHPVPSIAVTREEDPPPNPRHHDIHRRVFVGPMLESVISQTEANIKKNKGKTRGSSSSNEDGDDISEIIKKNAFTFFIHRGGRPEDWGEEEERSVVEETIQRWRGSEWGSIFRHRRQKNALVSNRDRQTWVGGSFEIGRLLGVNIVHDSDNAKERPSTAGSSSLSRRRPISTTSTSYDKPQDATSTQAQETFVTAPTGSGLVKYDEGTPATSSVNSMGISAAASSSTSLLRPALQRIGNGPTVKTEIVPRPIINPPSASALSDGALPLLKKGKTKAVHYADIDMPPTGTEEPPAPPSEVLERTEQSLQTTSAGAAAAAAPGSPSPSLDWGDVVMRDRMLVRTYYTKNEAVNHNFNELQHRTTRDLLDADWGEYMVAWRKDALELYSDYLLPMKEWLTGHKRLSFIIPLKSSKTQLSLYSFVDLTFCIQCAPVRPVRDNSKKRWFFHREKEGTNIFIFKLKSRSRAYDWIWQLWQSLGGQLPETLEVRNPRLNTRVKIDIPSADNTQISRIFDRENLISLCSNSLQSVPDWKALIEREIKEGKSLELAWRLATTLDWIWLDEDIDGKKRKWAVLCGLALRVAERPAVLEIRLAEHYPTYVHLKNGNRLHEPPGIEGYVDRIRPNTPIKQSLYLSTHDNYLFSTSRNTAYPPAPPGLAQSVGDIDTYAENLSKSEVQRGTSQILHATGVNDLRSILLIRRAIHLVPVTTHKEVLRSEDSDIWFSIWSQSEERVEGDNEDGGGEEVLNKAGNKPRLKMRRSFELLLTSGRVLRFETHSCRVAIEWIERLRALVLYWKQRLRIDAKEEMDLAQSLRPRLTPLTRANNDETEVPPEAPADLSGHMPALGTLYSWCVLNGCKSIIKGGKVYVRKGLYGQFKLIQLFLVAGHLAQFRVAPKTPLHATMQRKTNLIDAYICSGYLAALALPKGQYRADAKPDPRRYKDGLETDDPEEDMLFMVWYRPQVMMANPGVKDESHSSTPNKIPLLSAKRKCMVFRTRSKLERDAWCWALNTEIERLVRTQKDWEVKLRETGSLLSL